MLAAVREAVARHGRALQFADEELRNDRLLVMAAIHQSPLAMRHASEELRQDVEVVFSAVTQDASVLRFAGRNAVLLAVGRQGFVIEYKVVV